MGYTLSIRTQGRKFAYISKNRICTTVNSHINCNESNNLNTSNSYNVKGASNFPHDNVQMKFPLIHSLLDKTQLIRSQVLVPMIK